MAFGNVQAFVAQCLQGNKIRKWHDYLDSEHAFRCASDDKRETEPQLHIDRSAPTSRFYKYMESWVDNIDKRRGGNNYHRRTYGLNTAYTLSLTIPFSAAAGTIFNVVDIIITSN